MAAAPKIEFVTDTMTQDPTTDPLLGLETPLASLLTAATSINKGITDLLPEIYADMQAAATSTSSYLSDIVVSVKGAAASLLSMDARDASLAAKPASGGSTVINIQGNMIGNTDFLNQLSQQIATILKTQGVTA
jgi:hypothetical protein